MKINNILIAALLLTGLGAISKAESAALDFDGRTGMKATLVETVYAYGAAPISVPCEALIIARAPSAISDITQGNFPGAITESSVHSAKTEEDANAYLKALAQFDRSQTAVIREEIFQSPFAQKISYMHEHYVPQLIRKVRLAENKNSGSSFLSLAARSRRPGFVCVRREDVTSCGTKKITEWVCEAVGEVVNGLAGKVCSWVTSIVEDCSTKNVCVEWDQV